MCSFAATVLFAWVDGRSIFSADPSVMVDVSMLRPQMDGGEFPTHTPSCLRKRQILKGLEEGLMARVPLRICVMRLVGRAILRARSARR